MNNNEDNNSPVINKFTIIQSTPQAICTGGTVISFAQAAQLSPWIPSYICHVILSCTQVCRLLVIVLFCFVEKPLFICLAVHKHACFYRSEYIKITRDKIKTNQMDLIKTRNK